MQPRYERDDMLLGLSLATVGLGMVAAAIVTPARLLGPAPFGLALLLLVGFLVVLLGAGYLRSDRLQRAFGRRYLPEWVRALSWRDRLTASHALAMAGGHGGPWPERRSERADRRLRANTNTDTDNGSDRDRRAATIPHAGPDRRSGLDRRLPWDRREHRVD